MSFIGRPPKVNGAIPRGRASRGVRVGSRRAASGGVRLRDYGWFQSLQLLVDTAEALFDGAHSRVKPFDTCAK